MTPTTTTKTPKEWVQTPKGDLGVALAEELVPKPWEHKLVVDPAKFGRSLKDFCFKCKARVSILKHDSYPYTKSWEHHAAVGCTVPNPIDFKDWNVAKYWQGKCFEGDFERSMRRVYYALGEFARTAFSKWFKYHALPEHYLMAAALSQKRVKDRGEDVRGSAEEYRLHYLCEPVGDREPAPDGRSPNRKRCPKDATQCIM